MRQSENPRATGSKRKIQSAMLTLLGSKPLHRISVTEICSAAGVNRSTFYAHYDDVYDLMRGMERELVDPRAAARPGAARAEDYFSPQALLRMVAHLRENRYFYRYYLSAGNESELFLALSDRMQNQLVLPYLKSSEHFTEQELTLQYEFAKNGFLGVLRSWLGEDCAQPDEVIAGLLSKMLLRCLL